MESKRKATRKATRVKSASDRRSDKAFKITAKVKESTYQTIQSIRSGMVDV